MNLSLFLILSFLVGCATGPLKKDQADAVNNVAAISLFPDTLPVKYLGTTIFNNDHNYPNVSSWNLNQVLRLTIENKLQSVKKSYKKLAVDRSKINKLITEGNTFGNRLAGDEDKLINEYLFSQAEQAGAKYLFIFKPISHDNYGGFSPGIALYCRSAFGIEGEWQGYVLARVSLWDLTEKKIIFQNAITPHDLNFMTKQDCAELKKTTPKEFATSHKEKIIELAKKTAIFAVEKSGLDQKN